jgi:hypothetical protein
LDQAPAYILRIIHGLSACEGKKTRHVHSTEGSALLGLVDVADKIQLLACGYSAPCTVRGCRARGTMLARYVDGQGRPLRQRELCERHAHWLKANQPNVHELTHF